MLLTSLSEVFSRARLRKSGPEFEITGFCEKFILLSGLLRRPFMAFDKGPKLYALTVYSFLLKSN